MSLWGLELLIRACCVDGRDNVASDSEDEGIHRHLVQHLECVFGHERIELRAEQGFVVALNAERGHFAHKRLTLLLFVLAHAGILAREGCEAVVESSQTRGSVRLFTLPAPQ
jgi:hypothetical protein